MAKDKLKFIFRLIFSVLIIFVLIVSLIIIMYSYFPIFWAEIKYAYMNLFDEEYKARQKLAKTIPNLISGSEILLSPVNQIPEPVDKNFSIIIPKIGVNEKVVENVDISNKSEVENALKQGIGWAKGTVAPGEKGNSLLFSHSASSIWNVSTYNAEFTLLNKLEINDLFTIVYRGRQLDFIVFNVQIVEPNDNSYVTAIADDIIVTLQTCYPPGSDSKRLLVRGRLIAMQID